jgi:hypothetical protein
MNRTPSLHEIESATRRFVPDEPQPDRGFASDWRKTPAAPGLPLNFWGELGTVSPPDLLVRETVGINSLVVIYGDSGAAKTFFAVKMGLHIAEGTPFFGRPVTRGALLYVAAEGARGLNNRLAAEKLARDFTEALPFVVVPVPVDIGPDGPDAQAVITAAEAVERETGCAVVGIFLDTLARTIGKGDENTAADMGAYIGNADRIRIATGAAVFIIHHRGKSPNGPRGSSALYAAADTVILVEKRDGIRVATIEKQKDGAEGQEIAFTLEPVEVGRHEGRPIMSCIVVPADQPQRQAGKKPPSGKSGIILKALQRAVADAGEAAPASNHIPAGAKVVPVERWRQFAYQMMGEAEPEARKKAFQRGRDALLASAHATVWNDVAWLP